MRVGDILTQETTTNEPSQEELELGAKYLLAELESIRGFKEQSVAIGDKRVDFFITLTSTVLAGLGVLSQVKVDSQSFLFITLLSGLVLLPIGLIVVRQVIDRDILIVDYIRAINRIRAYFAEKAPHIQPFLLMPTVPSYPTYSWQSSNRRIPMIMNGLTASTIITVITLSIRQLLTLDTNAVVLGAVTFAMMYIAQEMYARRLFGEANTKAHQMQTVTLFNSRKILSASSEENQKVE